VNDLEKRRAAYRARKYVRSANDFPKGDHLAIIEFNTITIPGDERSRTNPGHGYPEHTETTMSYSYWRVEDRELWEAEIASKEADRYCRGSYIALDCGRRVTVEPAYKIKVS